MNHSRSEGIPSASPLLRGTDNTFRFVIRKISSTEPVFADHPEVETNRITSVVRDHFPGATVSGKVKVTTAAGVRISDWRREYLIIVTIADQKMASQDFDDSLNQLAAEFDYMHLDY